MQIVHREIGYEITFPYRRPEATGIMRTHLPAWLFILPLALYLANSIIGQGNVEKSAAVTFSKDIAPIIYRQCAECHRPGGIGPMSLLRYEDARTYAPLIVEKIKAHEMPPWHADPRFGEFSNARRLSSDEIRAISKWVDDGAPPGDAKDLPSAPQFSEQRESGRPDLVFTMPESISLPKTAVDEYLYFRIPTNFTEDKWIQSVEFRPGNRKIVHHAVAFIETPENFAAVQKANPSEKPGSAAWTLLETAPFALEVMDGPTRRIRSDAPVINDGCSAADVDAVGLGANNTVLSVYAPGRGVDIWPAGTAKKIPAGSNIILQMHYSKTDGKAEKDRTSIALTIAKTPVTKMVVSRSVSNFWFLIPPGADNHKVTACWNLQRDVELLSFMPHMHVRGKSMQYEVQYPDHRRETLLLVPHYDFHWQTIYTLRNPLSLSAGSRLIVTAYFDNSEKNMHNPDPSKTVRHGTATFDEMMIGFVDYVVPRPHVRVVAKIDPRIYDAYVGVYAVDPAGILRIIKDHDRLYAESEGQRVELFPITEKIFFSKNTESELTFVQNEMGEVVGFVVTLEDKLVRATKIKK